MRQVTLCLMIALHAAVSASTAVSSSNDRGDDLPRFIAEIVAVANAEVRKRGMNPRSGSVDIAVSNRPCEADEIILERLRLETKETWVVDYSLRREPKTTGGEISVYFRNRSPSVVGVWEWD